MLSTASAEVLKRNSRERAVLESRELFAEYELALMRIKNLKTRDTIKYWWIYTWMVIAAEFANLKIKALEAEAKYSRHLADIDENEDEIGSELFAQEKARDTSLLIEKLQAATLEEQLYQRQVDKITSGRSISESLAFLMARYIGVDGVGGQESTSRMTRVQQSQFRRSLFKEHDARLSRPKIPDIFDFIFDSATGTYTHRVLIVAVHLVPYQLGPKMMAALFGKEAQEELLSPRNGLLLLHNVERALDHGALAIVPSLEDDVSDEAIAEWVACDQREYKWKVIDPKAEDFLDVYMHLLPSLENPGMTVRELDGKQLHFRVTSTQRPRVKYIYFLFVLSVLKMAWRNDLNNRAKPENIAMLKQLIGKKAWTTECRYLHRAMVVALGLEEEELGYAHVDDKAQDRYLHRAMVVALGLEEEELLYAHVDDKAHVMGEIALLALIRAFDVLKTNLEKGYELELWGEDDETGDDDYDTSYEDSSDDGSY